MAMLTPRIKCTVAALLVTLTLTPPVAAQETDLDGLFQELFDADEFTHERVADRIRRRFEQSGSPAMDLLLRRGDEAADEGEYEVAIEHFTALIDHDPEFAEGYASRASAYFNVGLMGPALDDLRQALVLNPRHFEAMFGIGFLMEELGRQDQAADAYRAIQEIYPLEPQAAAALERLDLRMQGQAI